MTAAQQPSKVALIQGFTRGRIEHLQKQYLDGNPSARADLARFRRTIGKPLGETPETWQVFSYGVPNDLVGYSDAPSHAERAIYHAVTLYAVHQQSKTDKPMHINPEVNEQGFKTSFGIGDAIRQLAKPSGDDEAKSIMRRFTAITTAQTFEALTYHLRGLIQLFRSESIPLDYGQLAADLYRLQFPESAKSVHLQWARQLYRTRTDS